MEPLAVGPKEAARLLSLSVISVLRLVNSGQIPSRRVGRRTLISIDRLRDWFSDLPLAVVTEEEE